MSGRRTDPSGTVRPRLTWARAGRWTVRGVLLLFLLLFVLSVFGDDVEFDAGNTGRADVATPYLEQVAAGLAADRVFVDPAWPASRPRTTSRRAACSAAGPTTCTSRSSRCASTTAASGGST